MTNTNQIHFTVEQVTKLLQMQDTLNTYIHPEWKSQNFDWNFAIIDECREIKEHLGWKWWKDSYQCGLTEANRKQVQLEVIDILHFVLSIAAEDATIGASSYQRWLNNDNNYNFGSLDETVAVTLAYAADRYPNTFEAWNCLAVHVGLTTERVIETYTQKYVLNKFRQDHGYKDGSYVKEWKGWYFYTTCESLQTLEDNEVLEYLVKRLDKQERANEETLYQHLKLHYENRLNK